MKALVIKQYKDKATGKIQRKGKTIDITKERFEEINSTALGVFLEAKEKPEPKKPETKPATKKTTPKKK